ncbi:hypothetical protein TYRP_004334 [Tyrophagus putrescentiae]|nr:hypothetical protein TYRP_004334 [Tyrophagus putrescentiae]
MNKSSILFIHLIANFENILLVLWIRFQFLVVDHFCAFDDGRIKTRPKKILFAYANSLALVEVFVGLAVGASSTTSSSTCITHRKETFPNLITGI